MMPSAPVTFLKTCSEDQMRWCVGGGRAVEQTFPNFIRNSKTLRSLSNLETVEGVTVPDAQLQYKAIEIQTAWCGHRNRHRDQPSRTEKPDTDLRPYAQLIADKGGQSDRRCRKDGLFSMWCGAGGEVWAGARPAIRRVGG